MKKLTRTIFILTALFQLVSAGMFVHTPPLDSDHNPILSTISKDCGSSCSSTPSLHPDHHQFKHLPSRTTPSKPPADDDGYNHPSSFVDAHGLCSSPVSEIQRVPEKTQVQAENSTQSPVFCVEHCLLRNSCHVVRNEGFGLPPPLSFGKPKLAVYLATLRLLL